jgi:imidazolonepropionase-like amidohydrolase
MRHIAVFLLSVGLCFQSVNAQPQPPQQQKRKLALVGGMLIDGYQVPPVHHAAILIEGDKIVEVGPASAVKIPPDATVIDTSGETMMPGLIDLHVHLMILGHGDYGRWFPWIAEHGAERVMEISAKQLLMAGVTSAVDLVGPLKESLSVRDRINKGQIPGPRMSMSGPWITRVLGNYPPELKFQIKISNPDEAAKAAEELATAGVDVIKAYPMSFDEYKAVADVAHKHRLRVHAHVYDAQHVRDALNAGIDVLTHVGAASRQTYDPELVRQIVEANRPVVPTAALWFDVGPATIDFPERLQDPRLKRDFPPDIYKEVQDSFKNPHALGYFRNLNRVMIFGGPLVKQWIASGAVIGMGTDSGTPMNFHTEALWRELKVFVEQGMAPLRAIEAATRINAQILGKGNELGTIEVGKLADIIVVKGNPLANIFALDDPLVVVKGGVVYKGGPASQTNSTQRSQ